MSSPSIKRAGAAAVGAAILAAGLTAVTPAPAAHAETDPAPLEPGAAWLAGELSNGLIHDPVFDFDDYGATVEAAYTLDAVGAPAGVIDDITAALEAGAAAYTHPGEDIWAGSTGKLLSFVTDLAPTAEPTDFGGLNLVSQLEGRIDDAGSGPTAGRISDLSGFGDFANTFGQAWAVRGLTNAGGAEAGIAVDFLLQQQCSAGFFRLDFAAPGAADQSCDGATPAEDVPPVDTAATVVILLDDLATDGSELDAALDDAVAWIKAQQAPNGSFDGGTAAEGANANSTGLGGYALHLAGEAEAAADAATWLRARQVVGLSCDGKLKAEAGAIAYDQAALGAGMTEGIDDAATGQWRFATIQGLPALLAAPATPSDAISFHGLANFMNGGGTESFRVLGLAPGERGCASIGRNFSSVVGAADPARSVEVRVRVPNRTGFVPVEVTTGDEAVGTEGVALAAKRLPVELKARVDRGGTQRLVVDGLFLGERVVVKYDGKVVARGKATKGGGFVAKFAVGRQAGTHQVRVVGQFADRAATKSFKVG